MTRAEQAREVIETLDPLAVGEEVWFVFFKLNGKQAQGRGVVKWISADGDVVSVATGPELPTMPTFQVCIDDIVRNK